MTFWAFSITTCMQTMYRAKLDVCQMRCWPLRDLIKLLACGEVGGVLLMMSHWLCRGRVWWRAGRMTAGTVVITGGILATVILLCIIAVLCYCRLQVYLCVCARVWMSVYLCPCFNVCVCFVFFEALSPVIWATTHRFSLKFFSVSPLSVNPLTETAVKIVTNHFTCCVKRQVKCQLDMKLASA